MMLHVRLQLWNFPGLHTLHTPLLYSSVNQSVWMHTDEVRNLILGIDFYSIHLTVESTSTVCFNTKNSPGLA